MWAYPADRPEHADACHTWKMPLIEDAARANGTVVARRCAGIQATVGTFSTHTRQLICTGEGGFLPHEQTGPRERVRELRTSANDSATASAPRSA